MLKSWHELEKKTPKCKHLIFCLVSYLLKWYSGKLKTYPERCNAKNSVLPMVNDWHSKSLRLKKLQSDWYFDVFFAKVEQKGLRWTFQRVKHQDQKKTWQESCFQPHISTLCVKRVEPRTNQRQRLKHEDQTKPGKNFASSRIYLHFVALVNALFTYPAHSQLGIVNRALLMLWRTIFGWQNEFDRSTIPDQ